MKQPVVIYVISDAIGETAQHTIRAVTAQFEFEEQPDIRRHAFIRDEEILLETLEEAKAAGGIVVQTLVSSKLAIFAKNYCEKEKVPNIDLTTDLTLAIESRTGLRSKEDPGNMRRLDSAYFDRIAAIEFAVKYDDCKDPRGLLEADIVLVGVSRTSKTPLSSYLANQNFKVANVPLVPEIPLPEELFKIPAKRIIGLTTTPEKLGRIRKVRLRSMGLDEMSNYSSDRRILEELEYGYETFKTLGCRVIHVEDKAIEETAVLVQEMIQVN
ncbi:PEP synthetase regulatory protein [Listeria floridensis FSL S10-1187]|uniref:Putative pyruvate, phosphate dikinase regulatory protein n=1 Tax=Listeria floridensis FSL S10-1187 TaxID=1265817 RepID=A0ABP3B0K7_9LIST|nr:pyruvate, water dikinase regulatory protein [Listeria floridensis]EUJ32992.1 PEP synthetase regulatory protein [Listeria floridensis FSL S10-1187]